jgi:hypothetical protein
MLLDRRPPENRLRNLVVIGVQDESDYKVLVTS